MPSSDKFTHSSLLPAISNLEYVESVQINDTNRDYPFIQINLKTNRPESVIDDLNTLSKKHIKAENTTVSTAISLNTATNTVIFSPV